VIEVDVRYCNEREKTSFVTVVAVVMGYSGLNRKILKLNHPLLPNS
jgi:hypothetical protein